MKTLQSTESSPSSIFSHEEDSVPNFITLDFEDVNAIASMREHFLSLEQHRIKITDSATRTITELSQNLNMSNVVFLFEIVQDVKKNRSVLVDKIQNTKNKNDKFLSSIKNYFEAIENLEEQIENFIINQLAELSKKHDKEIDRNLLKQINSSEVLKSSFDAFREANEIRAGRKEGIPIAALFED